jgi:hypothetical protein
MWGTDERQNKAYVRAEVMKHDKYQSKISVLMPGDAALCAHAGLASGRLNHNTFVECWEKKKHLVPAVERGMHKTKLKFQVHTANIWNSLIHPEADFIYLDTCSPPTFQMHRFFWNNLKTLCNSKTFAVTIQASCRKFDLESHPILSTIEFEKGWHIGVAMLQIATALIAGQPKYMRYRDNSNNFMLTMVMKPQGFRMDPEIYNYMKGLVNGHPTAQETHGIVSSHRIEEGLQNLSAVEVV